VTPTPYTMSASTNRRVFLKSSAVLLGSCSLAACQKKDYTEDLTAQARFKISLAQWSLHRALRAGEVDNIDFARIAREDFGLDAVEWSGQFLYVDHPRLGAQPKSKDNFAEIKRATDDLGVANLLIMCDKVGNLGDPDEKRRNNAIEGHYAWVESAKSLGCHSIRVNAASDPSLSSEEQKKLCLDGLGRLCTFAQTHGLNVIVENHGGLSSNGAWLASVISGVGQDNCGTLPDFGNFYVARNRGNSERYALAKEPYENDPVYREDDIGLEYDRYQGVTDLMPFAKGVSAKSHDFDAEGNEVNTDYHRMMKIVVDSGYTGYIGIEYEGRTTPEMEGIRLTKTLIERTLASLHQST
jgi:L-ribulose-5-phosphate 3-epimerase